MSTKHTSLSWSFSSLSNIWTHTHTHKNDPHSWVTFFFLLQTSTREYNQTVKTNLQSFPIPVPFTDPVIHGPLSTNHIYSVTFIDQTKTVRGQEVNGYAFLCEPSSFGRPIPFRLSKVTSTAATRTRLFHMQPVGGALVLGGIPVEWLGKVMCFVLVHRMDQCISLSLSLSLFFSDTHTHTHRNTLSLTHARTHTHTHSRHSYWTP